MSRNKREGKFAGKFLGINFRMGNDEVWAYDPFRPSTQEAKYRNTRRIWISYNVKYKIKTRGANESQ